MSLESIYEAVLNGDAGATQTEVQAELDAGTPAEDILYKACIPAMEEVGRLFEEGEKRREVAVLEEQHGELPRPVVLLRIGQKDLQETFEEELADHQVGDPQPRRDVAGAGEKAHVVEKRGDRAAIFADARQVFEREAGLQPRELDRAVALGELLDDPRAGGGASDLVYATYLGAQYFKGRR